MEHSPKYKMVKKFYKVYKVWSIDRVRDAVEKGWITEDEFKELTGEDYLAMRVLASDRPVSKFEAVYHAHVMRDMFNQLVLRNFGIRDVGPIARRKYILGKDNIENRDKYECLLDEYRGAIVRFAASVVQDVSAANAIYPKNLSEYNQRRAYQTHALSACRQLTVEIQSVVDTFDVDVNDYAQ